MKQKLQLLLLLFVGSFAVESGQAVAAFHSSLSTSSSSSDVAVSMQLLERLQPCLPEVTQCYTSSTVFNVGSSSSSSSRASATQLPNTKTESCCFCKFRLEGSPAADLMFRLPTQVLKVFSQLFDLPIQESGNGQKSTPFSYKFKKLKSLEYAAILVTATCFEFSLQASGKDRVNLNENDLKVLFNQVMRNLDKSGVGSQEKQVQKNCLYAVFCWYGQDLDSEQAVVVERMFSCLMYGYLCWFKKKIDENLSSKEAAQDQLLENTVDSLKTELEGHGIRFLKRKKNNKGIEKTFVNIVFEGLGRFMESEIAQAVLAGKEKIISEYIQNLLSPRSRLEVETNGNSGGNSAERSLDSLASGSPKTPQYRHLNGPSPRAGDMHIEGDRVISGVSPEASPLNRVKRVIATSGVNNSDNNDGEYQSASSIFQYQPVREEPSVPQVGCCKRFYIQHPRVALGLAVTFVAAAAVGAWQAYVQFV